MNPDPDPGTWNANANQFERLPDDQLMTFLLMNDFLELKALRATCTRFRRALRNPIFIRLYNQYGYHPIWNFTLGNAEDAPVDQHVTGVREEDGSVMVFTVPIHDAVEEDVIWGNIELLGVFSYNILIGYEGVGYILCNMWTLRITRIIYPNNQPVPSIHLRWGTRVITDPNDNPYQIVSFLNGSQQPFGLFRYLCSPNHEHHFFDILTEVENLNAEDYNHALWMLVPTLGAALIINASIRNGQPVHFLQQEQAITSHFLNNLVAPEPILFMGELRNVLRRLYSCNEGYIVAVDSIAFQQIPGQVVRLALASYRPNNGNRYQLLSNLQIDPIQEDVNVLTRQHRLRVFQDLVNFSFLQSQENGSVEYIVRRYNLNTGRWTQPTRRLMPNHPVPHVDAVYCARLGISATD